jgi:hypothetical protein
MLPLLRESIGDAVVTVVPVSRVVDMVTAWEFQFDLLSLEPYLKRLARGSRPHRHRDLNCAGIPRELDMVAATQGRMDARTEAYQRPSPPKPDIGPAHYDHLVVAQFDVVAEGCPDTVCQEPCRDGPE